MKLIPLTQGQFAKVDDADFDELQNFSWRASWRACTKSFYAVRSLPRVNGKQGYEYLHRKILGLVPVSGACGDHANHDTLDCQRANLRACTYSQNLANKKGAHADSVSGVRGVTRSRTAGKWVAQIGFNGKQIHLGTYPTVALASAAYAAANKKYFGEFGGKL